MIRQGTLRTLFFIAVVIGGAYLSPFFEQLNFRVFEYQNPPGLFSMASLADGILGWVLGMTLLSGILFGGLGRKIDYIFILIFLAFGLWNYFGTDNVTPGMYTGLIGVALLGNAIGYCLKLARLKWMNR